MKKMSFLLAYVVMATGLAMSQDAVFDMPKAERPAPVFSTTALGTGFEMDFSGVGHGWAIPIEFRLMSPESNFNFYFGERMSRYYVMPDSTAAFVPKYYSMLMAPYYSFSQFSTYLTARWNLVPYSARDRFALYVGAGYMFNINANEKIYIDVPQQGPFAGAVLPTYTPMLGSGWQTYRCEEFLNPVSHSLRLEAGFGTPGFEVSAYALLALTSPVNLDVATATMYYDRTGENNEMATHEVDAGLAVNPYLPVNMLDYTRMAESFYSRWSFGFSFKFYFMSGYYKQLFNKLNK